MRLEQALLVTRPVLGDVQLPACHRGWRDVPNLRKSEDKPEEPPRTSPPAPLRSSPEVPPDPARFPGSSQRGHTLTSPAPASGPGALLAAVKLVATAHRPCFVLRCMMSMHRDGMDTLLGTSLRPRCAAVLRPSITGSTLLRNGQEEKVGRRVASAKEGIDIHDRGHLTCAQRR
ncbi:hypothetical protein VTO73DRAFT_1913 [Trametes versicolor]